MYVYLIQVRQDMLDFVFEFNQDLPELIICALPYVLSLYESLQFKAIQIFRSCGLPCIEHPAILRLVEDILAEKKAAELEKGAADIASVYHYSSLRLRADLQRYLADSALSPQIARTIADFTIFGISSEKKKPKKKSKSAKDREKNAETDDGLQDIESIESQTVDSDYINQANSVRDRVIGLRVEETLPPFDEALYPVKKDISLFQASDRSLLNVLQTPLALDLIDALNYNIHLYELRSRQQAIQDLREKVAENKAKEILAAQATERAHQQAMREKGAQERALREIMKLERIRKIREGDKNQPSGPKIHMKRSDMQTLGIGRTHPSECHHSRESLDMTIRNS